MLLEPNIAGIIRATVEGLGYEYVGCHYFTARRSAVLRVYIAHDSGVTIDDCTKVSRQLNAVLTVEVETFKDHSLEVSSPGLERPLFTLEHFQRFLGKKARVYMHSPIEGQKRFTGMLRNANAQVVELEGSEQQQWSLPFADIEKAHLIVDFD